MKIKIAKYIRHNYDGQIQVQVKFTLLGFLLRNSWTVVEEDFDSEYVERWIPCYINI